MAGDAPDAGSLRISTDPAKLDVDLIHHFLATQSTWARGIPRALVETSIRHSLCFGGFLGEGQVAFARVITDRATFANLVDVFVLPAFRGRAYATALMQAVDAHPDLQGLRRFTLATFDAHALYRRHGFTSPAAPATLMERYVPDIYARIAGTDAAEAGPGHAIA
ncbi:GNAT family N-acetyltransferase [Marilutibacter aestuarii]|uniref:GNAT family N-acetyltransferase n=1 Tax=Marilutibacter aestuarii TaxID=1706195 RepID=A0A508ALS8_9GAMM|nr:GNAT family N-acetyltransferase [Lysobacter aestuarii]TQD46602.1 GNAT family N-acetyltransferase [Lysobacter aestuarii]